MAKKAKTTEMVKKMGACHHWNEQFAIGDRLISKCFFQEESFFFHLISVCFLVGKLIFGGKY